jgi:hypothetical protein
VRGRGPLPPGAPAGAEGDDDDPLAPLRHPVVRELDEAPVDSEPTNSSPVPSLRSAMANRCRSPSSGLPRNSTETCSSTSPSSPRAASEDSSWPP